MAHDDEEEKEALNKEDKEKDDTDTDTIIEPLELPPRGRNEDLKIPRLFFQLYFGLGALVYTCQTSWVFTACCLTDLTFLASGFFYMLWIAILMWISTIFTFACFRYGINLRDKGLGNKKARLKFVVVILLKLVTDALVFHGTLVALLDPQLEHYHEFSQFVGPLIFYGLLYLVTIIEVGVFLLTVCLIDDPWGFFPFMEMLIDYKKQFMLKYCASQAEE